MTKSKLSVKVYNASGEDSGSAELNARIFAVEVSPEVIHQAVNAARSKSRNTVASTKTKGNVRGGGRKPWRQKGTGRARAGSIRSPLWKGGGVTFGPSANRNFEKKVTKKVKRLGIAAALTEKAEAGNVLVVDQITLEEGRTRELNSFLKKLSEKFDFIKKNILIVVAGQNEKLFRAGRNLPSVNILRAENINILDLMKADSLVFTRDALEKINSGRS